MKNYKVYSETTSFYYSTLSIVNWVPIFQAEPYFNIIIDSLTYCRIHKGLYLLGYIIMPSHLHLITSNKIEYKLPDIIRDFKTYTSKRIRNQLEAENRLEFLKLFQKAAKGLKKQNFKIWQDDYHPIALTSEKWLYQKMDYIHQNPVRKGFVEYPEQWKYSSARNWLLDDDRVMTIDRQVLFTEG